MQSVLSASSAGFPGAQVSSDQVFQGFDLRQIVLAEQTPACFEIDRRELGAVELVELVREAFEPKPGRGSPEVVQQRASAVALLRGGGVDDAVQNSQLRLNDVRDKVRNTGKNMRAINAPIANGKIRRAFSP